MPITVELREHNRVMYSTFIHPYTLTDALETVEKDKQLRDQFGGTIHSLVNLSQSGRPPSGILRVASGSPSLTHPTKGKLALVGASFLSQTIVEMASKLARRDREIFFFKTEAQAMDFLRQVMAEEDEKKAAQVSPQP